MSLLLRAVLITALTPLTLFATATAADAAIWQKCEYPSAGRKVCVYITENIANVKNIAYRDSVSNGRNVAVSGKCVASTSKTWTFSTGASVSGELKAGIFGGIKAEVNAGVSRSSTTTYGSEVSFKVPANSTVRCDRGVVQEWVKGKTVETYRRSDGAWVSKPAVYWKAQAPASMRWWVY